MAQPLPTYLRTHRRKWALTQRDLAELVGSVTPSMISKYETLARTPGPEVLLALEAIFGEPAAQLFPAVSHAARRTVLQRAELLLERLSEKSDARSLKKRRLLDAVISRSQQHHANHP